MAYNQPYYAPYYQPNFYNQNGASPDMLSQMKGQYQPQMVQQPSAPMPMVTSSLIYVDNEEQAKNYLVAPNNVVSMFDKNKPLLYVKGADGAGMPNFKKYTISEYVDDASNNTPKMPSEHVCKCGDKFATKEQFEALQGKYSEIMAMIEELKAKPTAKTTKSTKESAE